MKYLAIAIAILVVVILWAIFEPFDDGSDKRFGGPRL